MTVKEASKKWNISEDKVRKLIKESKVEGAVKNAGGRWIIPDNAISPLEAAIKKEDRDLSSEIDYLINEVDFFNDLIEDEKDKLNDLVTKYHEYTDSNNNMSDKDLEGNEVQKNRQIVYDGLLREQKEIEKQREILGKLSPKKENRLEEIKEQIKNIEAQRASDAQERKALKEQIDSIRSNRSTSKTDEEIELEAKIEANKDKLREVYAQCLDNMKILQEEEENYRKQMEDAYNEYQSIISEGSKIDAASRKDFVKRLAAAEKKCSECEDTYNNAITDEAKSARNEKFYYYKRLTSQIANADLIDVKEPTMTLNQVPNLADLKENISKTSSEAIEKIDAVSNTISENNNFKTLSDLAKSGDIETIEPINDNIHEEVKKDLEDLLEQNAYGKAYIINKLKEKGYPQDYIDEEVNLVDWKKQGLEVYESRLRHAKDFEDPKEREEYANGYTFYGYTPEEIEYAKSHVDPKLLEEVNEPIKDEGELEDKQWLDELDKVLREEDPLYNENYRLANDIRSSMGEMANKTNAMAGGVGTSPAAEEPKIDLEQPLVDELNNIVKKDKDDLASSIRSSMGEMAAKTNAMAGLSAQAPATEEANDETKEEGKESEINIQPASDINTTQTEQEIKEALEQADPALPQAPIPTEDELVQSIQGAQNNPNNDQSFVIVDEADRENDRVEPYTVNVDDTPLSEEELRDSRITNDLVHRLMGTTPPPREEEQPQDVVEDVPVPTLPEEFLDSLKPVPQPKKESLLHKIGQIPNKITQLPHNVSERYSNMIIGITNWTGDRAEKLAKKLLGEEISPNVYSGTYDKITSVKGPRER